MTNRPWAAEPDYLAQCNEPMTAAENYHWFQERAREARAKGCEGGRGTRNPQNGAVLYEGWKVMPDDLGEPRWQMTGSA